MNNKIAITLLLGLSLILPAWAEDDPDSDEALRYYDDAKVIRVKYADGEAFVERESEEGWEDLIENLPIFEGDFLSTEDGRAELYLGRLNYLRIDRNSQLGITQAPVLRGTDWSLDLVAGSIIVDLHQLEADAQASVHTADCEVFFVTSGLYRIDRGPAGDTRVWVIQGKAQVLSEGERTRLSRNDRLRVEQGRVMRSDYEPVDDRDDFMAFQEERSRGQDPDRTVGTRYLEEGLEEYEPELSSHGRWEYSPIYGCHVWYPYGLGLDWQPYLNGRWTWHPFYGYVWTSYDPCGWITHHYGRWHWHPGHGWYWLPDYQWSPAWVYWGWDNDFYSWVPLGRNNRPVIVINKRWLRDYNHRQGLPAHASSVVVVHRDRLRSQRIGEHITRKIGSDLIQDRIHFRGKAPLVVVHEPLLQGRTRSGKTVLLKKGAVKRTPVDPKVPLIIPEKTDERPSMEDSIRSVRRVVREKGETSVQVDAGQAADSGSPPATIKKKGSTRTSSGRVSSPKSTGTKKAVRKKKD